MVAIFVVLTILVCVSIDAIIQKRKAHQLEDRALKFIPNQARVHQGHAWAAFADSDQIRIGIDGFLTQLFGPIDHAVLHPVGSTIRQGDPMLTLQKGNRTLHVRAPLSGIVRKTNSDFDTGNMGEASWTYAINPTRLVSEWPALKAGEVAREWLETEWKRLATWLTNGHTFRTEMAMQDGGLPAPDLLQHLSDEEWLDFQREFLDASSGGGSK